MITFALVACNRFHYFRNCLESVFEFVDLEDVNIIIVDNHTVEPEMEPYLNSLPKNVEIKRYKDRNPHDLYRAMNYAISYARKKGDLYINFLQEDYQYLYKIKNLCQIIHDTFVEKGNVVQLQTNMGWASKDRGTGVMTTISAGGAQWFLLKDKYTCDNGFTRLSLYDKIGMYPDIATMRGGEKVCVKGEIQYCISGEKWASLESSKQHLRRMMITTPNMGMMMDGAYVRENKRFGKYFPPPNKFYLKPFSSKEIGVIREKGSRGEICFNEDFVEADGWVPETRGKHAKSKEFVKF